MKAKICETTTTIAYDKARYRVNTNNKWSTLMWGTWPDSNGIPSYRWESIPEDKVPDMVRKKIS